MKHRRTHASFGKLLLVLATLILALAVNTAAFAQPRLANAQQGAYHNPVIPQNAADPSIIRALDGYYYLYATTTNFGTSPVEHIFPIWRSTDLTHWTYVGDAFKRAPDWVEPVDALWAPDVHYFHGQYYLYYTSDLTKALPKYNTPAGVSSIGVATAPTPLGPWTDAGPSAGGDFAHGPLVPPSWGWCTDPTNPACYNWEFDSFVYTGPDGQRWLYEGSYFGGNRVHALAPDGLSLAPSSAIQFGHNIRYEASYVIPHEINGQMYYYMLNSQSDCCVGANSPYSVVANRSTSPQGPFSDQNGMPMEWAYGPVYQNTPGGSPFGNPIWWNLADEAGGYPVLKQNGNAVVGPGGQAVVTDITGQDWLVYHGINQHEPWANNGHSGDTSPLRQLYLNQLNWTADGWPLVNDGNGPDLSSQAPATTPWIGDNFNQWGDGAPDFSGPARAHWEHVSGNWQLAVDPTSGGYLHQENASESALIVTTNKRSAGTYGFHAQCDLRADGSTQGSYGCAVFATQNPQSKQSSYLAVSIDLATHQLVLAPYQNGQVVGATVTANLPASFAATDWNRLAIDFDPTTSGSPTLTAMLENEDGNPLAVIQQSVSAALAKTPGGLAFLTNNTAADFDNVTLAERAHTLAQPATAPTPGTLDTARSDTFNNQLGPQWDWLRENPALHSFAPDGALSLTSNGNLDEWQRLNLNATQPPELSPTQNILLQSAPQGDYMIETKMHFDPETPNLEAGLIVYSDDDTNVQNDITWNGVDTQVASIRNELSALPDTLQACPLVAPMTGANVAVTQYTHNLCPPMAEHTSQEYPANAACCWVGNGQGPGGSYAGGNLDPSRITVWLRIYRHGDVYTPWLSLDGKNWMRENAWTLKSSSPAFPMKIGVFAQNNQQANAPGAQAWFDYFNVYTQS